MMVACDGIWDCVTNEECARRLTEKLDKYKCAENKELMSKPVEELFGEIIAPRIERESLGTDNMTAILVYFHNNDHIKSH